MKILVTGAAGFIGSFVTRDLLSLGHDVIGIDNFDPLYDEKVKKFNLDLVRAHIDEHPQEFETEELKKILDKINEFGGKENGKGSYKFENVDITDYENLERVIKSDGFDAIIHFAAMASVPQSIAEPRKYTEINIDGTVNLLELAAQNNIKKFIFASTSSVYGNTTEIPFNEETSNGDQSISQYGATKRMGEIIAYTYHYLYKMDIAILRFFTVYGPLQRPYGMAIQKFIRLIDHGKPMTLYGDGSMERDYAYIDDITAGVIAALDKVEGFETINLGSKSTISLNDLANIIKKHMGKGEVTYLPSPPTEVQVTYADVSKAQRILGFDSKVDLDEGIRRQIEIFNLMPEWYKEIET